MRLIRTRAPYIELVEVSDEKIRSQEIRYAILSHRWGDEEISFQDVINPNQRSEIERTEGYRKIKHFCAKAAPEYEFAWVDTCCINKDSSTELSEAINSMYRWYRLAGICYAYLNDVGPRAGDEDQVSAELESSQWLSRGWTLQELIAPPHVVFLARDWSELGTKQSLVSIISDITRIDMSILLGEMPLHKMSIAKRMSWASTRVTTRVEDIAYCLMGIFDVNMPLLYGEGWKAFIRLQEEIMKDSSDQTIFAWENHKVSPGCPSGLLATSPRDFISSGSMLPFNYSEETAPFEVSNRGIKFGQHMTLSWYPQKAAISFITETLVLNCQDTAISANYNLVGVQLLKSGDQANFVRISPTLKRHISWTQFHFAKCSTVFATKTLPALSEVELSGIIQKPTEAVTIPGIRSAGKNIIILLDCKHIHTREESKSHLEEIYSSVQHTGDCQVSYYENLQNLSPGSDCETLRKHMSKAYRWLGDNYQDTDKIFLFGYSVGAEVVRGLAQILETVGIAVLHGCPPEPEKAVEIAWGDTRNWRYVWRTEKKRLSFAYSFKPTGRVTFMGLFHAVGTGPRVFEESEEIINSPSEVTHPAHIVRHAIAIDEKHRGLQSIFAGDPIPKGTQDIQQMWFAGDHGDIGGVSLSTSRSFATTGAHSKMPLAWIVQRATEAGMILNKAIPHRRQTGFQNENAHLVMDITIHDLIEELIRYRNRWSSDLVPALGFVQGLVSYFGVSRSAKFVISKSRHTHIPVNHRIHRSVIEGMMTQRGYRPWGLAKVYSLLFTYGQEHLFWAALAYLTGPSNPPDLRLGLMIREELFGYRRNWSRTIQRGPASPAHNVFYKRAATTSEPPPPPPPPQLLHPCQSTTVGDHLTPGITCRPISPPPAISNMK